MIDSFMLELDWTMISLWMPGFALNEFRSNVGEYTSAMTSFAIEYKLQFGFWADQGFLTLLNPQPALHNLYVRTVRLNDMWNRHVLPALRAGNALHISAYEFFVNFMQPFDHECAKMFGFNTLPPYRHHPSDASVQKYIRAMQTSFGVRHGVNVSTYVLDDNPVEGVYPFDFVANLMCDHFAEGTRDSVIAESPEFEQIYHKILSEYHDWLRSAEYDGNRAVGQDLRHYLRCKYDCEWRRSLPYEDRL
jgi:hypothetical protein